MASNGASSFTATPTFANAPPSGVSEADHISRPYRVDHFSEDVHVFYLGRCKPEVLHIPGHTPSAMAALKMSTSRS